VRTYTVVERVGENMGPIEWGYDFWPHFSCYCSNDDGCSSGAFRQDRRSCGQSARRDQIVSVGL
jgi:hypothetical protein